MKPREILEKEELCIEEHAPFCMAECPVHFDSREMCILIENGDWKGAYARYQEAVLFPEEVSRQCSAPCEAKCKRREVGEPISICDLEKAVVRFGAHEIKRPTPEVQMKKRVAVIGAGFAARAAAYMLVEKGYPVDRFDEQPEGAAAFDAVFFGDLTEEAFCGRFGAEGKTSEHFFAGGMPDIISQICYGKGMATTLDRFLKGVSITAGRGGEGSCETRLFTSVEGILPAEKVTAKDGAYTQEEASEEAQRCIKCRCMECVKECAFMDKFEKYPRKYIREVFNNICTGRITIRAGKPMINSCTLCGLCGHLCVNHVPMADIYRSAREALVKLSAMPPRYHDFPLRDMQFSNSDSASFFRHAKGQARSKYMFFPGCQMAALRSENIRSMYEYLLAKVDPEVGLMLGCCGAPASWAGRKDLYEQVMGDFRKIWEEAGRPEIITACPTCNREFSEALPSAKVSTIWGYYAKHGLPEEGKSDADHKEGAKIVTVHDPCTTRFRGDMHEEIRDILRQKGYTVKEMDFSGEKTRCCGYGGLTGYFDPELAGKFANTRVAEMEADGVTYCAVCRDFLANEDKPVFHILDVIYGTDTKEKGFASKMGISEKVRNKTALKNALLRELWGEESELEQKEYDGIALRMNEEVARKLEDRLILEENLKEVIHFAEETGAKIVKPDTGHLLASKRIGIVTYWVEYEPAEGVFFVHSAYSHRVQIMED